MEIVKQAIAGVKWTTLATVVSNIFSIIQVSILARLLNVADFGLMALVAVAIGFSEIFVDIGISNAIIYKQEVNSKQLSTLYWLNILVGLLFFFLLTVFSSVFSSFYNNAELKPLLNLVAVTFLIKPWGQQYMVLLQKNMQFNLIAKAELTARIGSFILTIVLALKDYGVYSLAIGTLFYSLISAIGYIYSGRKFQKPELYFNVGCVREFVNFGIYQMGEKVLNYFSSQFDSILIGKFLGVEVLGIYNVAKNIAIKPFSIINPTVNKVTFPLMSKVNNNPLLIQRFYLKTTNYLSYINFPIYTIMIVLATPIVLILFGKNWLAAIPILQILSVTYMLSAVVNPQGVLILSLGKARTNFLWNLLVFVFYPASIYVGSHWGIIGIAYSILILKFILLFVSLEVIVNKNCHVSIFKSLKAISLPLFISIVSMILPYFMRNSFTPFLAVILNSLLFFVTYLVLVFFLDKTFYHSIKSTLGKRNVLG